nr:hypothetical protein AXX17_AT4G35880 [Ipomoea trifida]
MANRFDNLGLSRSIINFRQTTDVQDDIGVAINARLLTTNKTVDIVLSANSDEANRVFNTMIIECNDEIVKKDQAAAYYCSALLAIFPGLQPQVMALFHNQGITVNQLRVADLPAHGIDLQPHEDSRLLFVYLGQLILILYKNIMPRSYDTFMRNHTRALKAAANDFGDVAGGDAEPVLSVERAEHIKTIVGGDNDMRKFVLFAVLNNRKSAGPIGRITKSGYPHYFRIFHPLESSRFLERSRFPILIAVAQMIKGSRTNNVNQFESTLSMTDVTVMSLYNQHIDGIARRRMEGDMGGRVD